MSRPTSVYTLRSSTDNGLVSDHEVIAKSNAEAFAAAAKEIENDTSVFAPHVTSIRIINIVHPPKRMF